MPDFIGVTVGGIAVGDLNGDGIPDIVFASGAVGYDVGTVDVLLGNKAGGFSAPLAIRSGLDPTSVAIADVNGDGHADLIVGDAGDQYITGGVDVLLGNGAGAFSDTGNAAIEYTANASVTSVSVEDVNGDGHPDIVATSSSPVTVELDGTPVVGDGAGGNASSGGHSRYGREDATGRQHGDSIRSR